MSKSSKNKNSTVSPSLAVANSWLTKSVESQKRTIYLIIFAVSFLFYGNTMWNGYSMDDELVTENHHLVSKGISGIPKIFTSHYAVHESQGYEYRPIVLMTYAIEYQFFGANAGVSHFINVLLYTLTGIILFNLLLLFFKNEHWILPLLGVFFFLIHPIHTEVIASLKNRDEILAFLFALLSLRFFFKYAEQKTISSLIYGVLFFTISLLCKKSTLTMIALIPVSLYYFSALNWKKILLFSLCTIFAFIIYRLSMKGLLETTNGGREALYFENPMYDIKYSFIERIAFGFHTTGFYLLKMLLPYPLIVYYGYNSVGLGSWSDPATLLAIPIVLFFLFNSLRKIKQKNIFDFGVLWFFIAISMYANVIVPAVGIVAERFAYIPSLGFAVVMGWLIYKYFFIREKESNAFFTATGKIILIGLFTISSIYTICRNMDWNSRFSIYSADVIKAPESAKLHALLGAYHTSQLEQIRSGRIKADFPTMKAKADSAKMHFAKAIYIYDGYTTMYNNLGTIYYSYLDKPDSALYCFTKAVELDSNYAQALLNTAVSYERYIERYELMTNFYSYFDPENERKDISEIKNIAKVEFMFDEIRLFENHLKNYISGLIYSGSRDRMQTFQNEVPGVVDQGIAQYFSLTEIKPNRDTLIFKLSTGLKQYLNNEVFGDPLRLKSQVLFETFGNELYKWSLETIGDTNGTQLKNYAIQQLKLKNTQSIHYLNRAVSNMHPGNYNTMMLAFDKLNKLYQKIGAADSIISLNSRYLDNPYFQTELLMIEVGNGYLLKGDVPESIEWYKKSIDENIKILSLLQTIHQHLSSVGGSSHFVITDWYKSKANQIMETYYKIGSKLNETGQGEQAQFYFAQADKYKLK